VLLIAVAQRRQRPQQRGVLRDVPGTPAPAPFLHLTLPLSMHMVLFTLEPFNPQGCKPKYSVVEETVLR
jgi:hypothetical protein